MQVTALTKPYLQFPAQAGMFGSVFVSSMQKRDDSAENALRAMEAVI